MSGRERGRNHSLSSPAVQPFQLLVVDRLHLFAALVFRPYFLVNISTMKLAVFAAVALAGATYARPGAFVRRSGPCKKQLINVSRSSPIYPIPR